MRAFEEEGNVISFLEDRSHGAAKHRDNESEIPVLRRRTPGAALQGEN